MKNFIFLIFLIGLNLCLTSCKPAYVSVKPTYVEEVARPARPSNNHIWIDGGWVWNNGSHSYVRRNSYWAKPNRNRNYMQGYWKETPRGFRWTQGHWR